MHPMQQVQGHAEAPLELEIDLNVLNHLGLNLYSNVPAVLSELIANAWDADASQVSIDIDRIPGAAECAGIVIADDGCGMGLDDLRNKYLKVGYQRRQGGAGDRTPGGRLVMGRKGIGKLSIFSIAGNVRVFTRKAGMAPIGIEMDVEKIQHAIRNGEKYSPVLLKQDAVGSRSIGTTIELRQLKKRVNSALDSYVRQRVARRFSVVSDDFEVSVNGVSISIADRNYFGKLEKSFVYDDFDRSAFKHEDKHTHARCHVIDDSAGYSVRGWIGLVRESGSLQDDSGNLNKLSILARGKVALEDILEIMHIRGLYAKYVIGEIEADFLDLTSKDDIATSSRQDFMQDDARFDALRRFLEAELACLGESRARMKEEEGERRAVEIPAVKEWYRSLKSDSRGEARKLFGKINQITTDEDHRKTLYKHGILAFEHLRHKEKLTQLGSLDVSNLEATVKLFSEIDDIEASWYYQITESRLDMIRKLQNLTDENALERVIQEHIYTHLWLLDPSWDRATETPSMERTVRAGFEQISAKLNQEEKDGRIDIRYKKTSGKHVIIELKRASAKLSIGRLFDQVDRYRGALEKQLADHKETGPIEVICLVGSIPASFSSENSERLLNNSGIRIITYQQLIKDAENSYGDYLAKAEDKGRIRKLLDAIDASGGN